MLKVVYKEISCTIIIIILQIRAREIKWLTRATGWKVMEPEVLAWDSQTKRCSTCPQMKMDCYKLVSVIDENLDIY